MKTNKTVTPPCAIIAALLLMLLISACNAPPEGIYDEISSRQYNVEKEYIDVSELAAQDVGALREEIDALDVNIELLDFSSQLPVADALDVVSLSVGGTLTRSEWESLFRAVTEEYFGTALTDDDITYFMSDGSMDEYPVTHGDVDSHSGWMLGRKGNGGAVFQPASYWFRMHRGEMIEALALTPDAWWFPGSSNMDQRFDLYRGEGMGESVMTLDGQLDVSRAAELARAELEAIGSYCTDQNFSYAPYRVNTMQIGEEATGLSFDMRTTYKGVDVDFSYGDYNYVPVSGSEDSRSPFSGTGCEVFFASSQATDYLSIGDMIGKREVHVVKTLSSVISLRSAASIVSRALAPEKEFVISSIEFVYLFEYAQEDIGTREAATEMHPFWKFNISNNDPKLSIFIDAANGEAHILRASD